ncbi:DUF1615 family protein [Shigella flexneri]
MWFGTYHLLTTRRINSARQFSASPFQCRVVCEPHASLQNAVSKASGVKLAMDGDLILYGSSEPAMQDWRYVNWPGSWR